MNIQRKARNVFRALVQRYGSERQKKRLWDDEYASGRWNYLDETGELSVHSTVEKYASNGSILDLGCGSATASIELNPAVYSTYTGCRKGQSQGSGGRPGGSKRILPVRYPHV